MVSITSKTRTIANGMANDGSVVEQSFVELYSNDVVLAEEVNAITSGTKVFTGNKTFSGTVNFGRTSDPASPNNGDLWFNTTAGTFKVRSGGITKSFDPGASRFKGTTAPVYATASTFTVAEIADRDSTNTVNIINTSGPITVNIDNTGLNGIAQSGNLTGTVSTMKAATITLVNSTTDTLTFGVAHGVITGQPVVFKGTLPTGLTATQVYYANVDPSFPTTMTLYTSEANAIAGTPKVDITTTTTGGQLDPTYIVGKNTAFNVAGANLLKVGDVISIGGQNRRVISVPDPIVLTVESDTTTVASGVNYKRGGKLSSTWYNLYSVQDSSSGTVGLLLYTRNAAASDAVPELSGYYYRQLSFALRIDSSGNIIPFYAAEGWPNRPKILYQVAFEPMSDTPGATNVLDGGSASAYTDLSLASFVPPISKQAIVFFKMFGTAGHRAFIRTNGTSGTDELGMVCNTSAQFASLIANIQTDASRLIEYKISGGTTDIDVMGYVVTEIN